jgi:hypothetical protein
MHLKLISTSEGPPLKCLTSLAKSPGSYFSVLLTCRLGVKEECNRRKKVREHAGQGIESESEKAFQ